MCYWANLYLTSSHMNISVWNLRGLNIPHKHPEIRSFLSVKSISLLALLETRVKFNKSITIRNSCCAGWRMVHNYSEASNGRIWVLWHPNYCSVEVLNLSDQFIHCKVTSNDGSLNCHITFIYGWNSGSQRLQLWKDLVDISKHMYGPWLCSGDFNAILKEF